MPFNGTGGFTVYTPGNPAVPGTSISSAAFNATMADFATGLANTLTRDGQSPATANIPMGGNKITGLGPATVAGQAVRFEQLPTLATLGAAASGANTDITSITGNAATATTAAACSGNAATATTASNAIGAGQSWSLQARSLSTTYTNSTGRTIAVSVSVQCSATNVIYLWAYVNGLNIVQYLTTGVGASYPTALGLFFLVPSGQNYMVSASGTFSLQYWNELR